MRKRAKLIKNECSTQQNPNYWLKKLMIKSNILQQAISKKLEIEELWRLSNTDVCNSY